MYVHAPSHPDASNCVAIGTMEKDIEIWDIDLIDAVDPLIRLHGCPQGSKKKKKSKKGQFKRVYWF